MASSGEDTCDDGRVTGDFVDEVPNFQIDIFSEREEHPGRFAEVSESDVENFIEGEENANTKRKTFYDLKLVKKFLVVERDENDSFNWIRRRLEPVCLAARTKTGKDYETTSLRGTLGSVKRHLIRYSYGKSIFKLKTVI